MWIIVGVSLDFKPKSFFSRIRVVINFCSVLFFALVSVHTVWSSYPDFGRMVGYLIPLTGSVYLVIASYFYMFKIDELYTFNTRMEKLFKKLTESQKAIVKNSVKVMPLVLKFYLILISIPTIEPVLTPLIVGLVQYCSFEDSKMVKWGLPYSLEIPFIPIYSVRYVLLSYGVLITSFMNYYNAICYGMCLLLRGHFQVVQKRFKDLQLNAKNNKDQLRVLIEYHIDLLNGVAEFHKGFEPLGIILFVGISLIFCGIIFVITQVG